VTSRISLSDSHKDEILTLREVLGTPSFQDTEVLAGAAGLDRVVASVNVMENPDIIPWVKNRELLITVGYSLAGRGKDLATLINDLADQDLAGFGIKLGPYITEVSADALDAANRRNFPILSLPPTVSFDDLIADVYRARGSLLLGGLHRRSDREHELISVSLEGGGPNEVAARLAQLVSCEVVVLGPNNEVLSHHSAGGEASEEDRDPRHSSRFDDAVTAPIVFGSTYVGQLYVLPNEGPLEGFSPGLVPRCAQIMALAASREIAVSSVDRQFRAELLEQILRNRLDRREVDRRCQALDWTISYPAVVVSLSPTELDTTPHLERARDALGWSLRARGLHAPHAIINGRVVAIVGRESSAATDPETTAAEATSEVVSRSVTGTWSAGISGPIDSPTDLLRGWDQARTATRVTRAIKGVGAVGKFTELGVFRLLSEVDPSLLQGFAKEVLGELYEPSAGRAELRRTLAVLLDTNLNVAKTARELHYHYNSVRYRVAQLEQLLGPFLTDPTRRLELHVALLIGEIVPEDEVRSP
jgi:purine catabolism regulator